MEEEEEELRQGEDEVGILPRTTPVCRIGRRRFGTRAYLKIGNEVSPSLPPITPKQMATFGKGFYNQIF